MTNDPYFFISRIYDLLTSPFLMPFKRATLRVLDREFPLPQRAKILEVACGTGVQARMLADGGFRVTGVDMSPSMLAKAGEKSNGGNPHPFRLILGDAVRLPFPDASFDATVVQIALHEMDPGLREHALEEMLRVTRNQGLAVIVDFSGHPVNNVWKLLLDWGELSAGWTHFRNSRRFIREGGTSALLRRHGLSPVSSVSFFKDNMVLIAARKQR